MAFHGVNILAGWVDSVFIVGMGIGKAKQRLVLLCQAISCLVIFNAVAVKKLSAEELLSESALKESGLNAQPIRQRWEEHLSGIRKWHYALWPVLMFQAWQKLSGGGTDMAPS